MSYDPHDTIVAVATPPGGAARGAVRISGQSVHNCVERLFSACHGRQVRGPAARAVAGTVRIASNAGAPLVVPCDLLIWPGTRSYTREPLAELHIPGSPPLVDLLVTAICAQGVRLAEPGEFTLRAFLAGRIDLTQAEAVLGVVDADDVSQYRTALLQLAGGLGRPLDGLRDNLLQLLAELEAGLDFVDEDIEFISPAELSRRLAEAHAGLSDLERQFAARHDTPALRQAVLVGPPNVGKSSLFNALASRYGLETRSGEWPQSAAIVSAQEGTTRDFLVVDLDLDGLRCQLVDTAGLNPQSDSDATLGNLIDRAAQLQAISQGRQATVRIHCSDQPAEMQARGERTGADLPVLTKSDRLARDGSTTECAARFGLLCTSSRTGDGLEELALAIRAAVEQDERSRQSEVVGTTAVRCRESVRLATESLATARSLADSAGGDELIAAEIRAALHELGKVVGATCTDDILDRIFSSFCIGK